MKKLTTNEIRQMWIDFWETKEHLIINSKSLVPFQDDSLLFINSGVATLKKYLSGQELPPKNRIANYQKSLRTNDIENVGVTARHHTMFEMLGNFSIGDYFKEEAITWGWELLTDSKWFNFDKEKLYITVHPDDEKTYKIWCELGVDPQKIIKTADNFWEIGKGPGGPNTEIFYDRGEHLDSRNIRELLEKDLENDRVIEIWNIVFSQYNCNPEINRSEYPELPQKNIDTGMGLERMACVIQEVETNFETDNFKVIMEELEKITNTKYAENKKAYRVITDHIRALTFAISDGVLPTNEGRGYVIRRLLRRGVKYGYLDLNIGNEPFMYKLVDKVIEQMEIAYPELKKNSANIKEIVKREEEKFLETIKEGLKHFADLTKELNEGNTINGDKVFKLYDTYGFPIELTEELALDKNLKVDFKGYEEQLEEQRKRARNSRKNISGIDAQNDFLKNIQVQSDFVGYTQTEVKTKINLITDGTQELTKANAGETVYILLEQTPFYATSGGQECDLGQNEYLKVINVTKLANGQHIHEVEVLKEINLGQEISISIDKQRRNKITINHSSTHLLHYALTSIFGEEVKQAGSYQDDKRTRFDYTTHNNPTIEQIQTIQNIVNEEIQKAETVIIKELPIEEAKKLGAKAQFGEKYGELVRVVKMGESIELCGGTHINNTKDINKFLIISDSSIGSGTRRIEAICNQNVDEYIDNLINNLIEEENKINTNIDNKIIPKLDEYQKIISKLEQIDYQKFIDKKINNKNEQFNQQIETLKKEIESTSSNLLNQIINQIIPQVEIKDNINYLESEIQNISSKQLKELADKTMEQIKTGVIILKLIENNKIQIVVKVSDDLSKEYHAGNIIKEKLKPYNGRGGGKPTFAQGGGEINN